MSSKPVETENTAEKTDAVKNAAPTKYTVQQLGKKARKLFGISPSTFAGATYGLDSEYTVEEMKNHIDKWLKKEVK